MRPRLDKLNSWRGSPIPTRLNLFLSFPHCDQILQTYELMARIPQRYISVSTDMKILVMPNVYAPDLFTDSLKFAEIVPDLVGDSSLLEVGCGTGILSLLCAKNGAYVVATDINPYAVMNSRINSRILRLSFDVRKGDIYSPVKKTEKFDFIFWLHPFNNSTFPVEDVLLRSGFEYKYAGLRRYISEARSHLTPKGRLLLGTGSNADVESIKTIAGENGYAIDVLREMNAPLIRGSEIRIRYLLIEFVPKSRV